MTAFYRDAVGQGHRVTVVETGKRMTLVEYFDNTRRGERFKSGRRYSHATRVRVYVYNNQLSDFRTVDISGV